MNKPVDELFASVISNKYKDASDDRSTTIQTFLEAVVKAELFVGYLVRARK